MSRLYFIYYFLEYDYQKSYLRGELRVCKMQTLWSITQ